MAELRPQRVRRKRAPAALIRAGIFCERGSMSVFDDGTDLADPPVIPAEEHRGGENPDWDAARPGEPLPEKDPDDAS